MYIDLVRAYLATFGSQFRLARTLGVTEAYLSYLLRSTSSTQRRRFDDTLQLAPDELAAEFTSVATPSPSRAATIAELLCGDRERRDVLHYHLTAARTGRVDMPRLDLLDRDAVADALAAMHRAHTVALDAREPGRTREAYAWVWETGTAALHLIDPHQFALDRVQVLLFLHDAASILDRQDLGLGYAREAQLLLAQADHGRRGVANRLRLNALLAEAVSLNNLGLWREALAVAGAASASVDGRRIEPEHWQRSFHEQQLSAMAASPRFSVYEAETIADRAGELACGDPVLQVGTTVRLANVYLARATPRSVRKAGRLLAELGAYVGPGSPMSSLRQVQVMRSMARHSRATHDRDAWLRWHHEAAVTTAAAGLVHQASSL